MDRAIITVKFNSTCAIDLELPLHVNAQILAPILAESINNLGQYSLGCNPIRIYSPKHNRLINDHETLSSLGLWEGSEIILK